MRSPAREQSQRQRPRRVLRGLRGFAASCPAYRRRAVGSTLRPPWYSGSSSAGSTRRPSPARRPRGHVDKRTRRRAARPRPGSSGRPGAAHPHRAAQPRALHRMLSVRVSDKAFSATDVRRLQEVSGGNPFFALELARALERRGGPGSGVSEVLPVPERLNELVGERLATCPRKPSSFSGRGGAVQPRRFESSPPSQVPTGVRGRGRQGPGDRSRAGEHSVHAPPPRSAAYCGGWPFPAARTDARLAGVVVGTGRSGRPISLLRPRARTFLWRPSWRRLSQVPQARGAPAAAASLAEHARRLTPPEDAGDLLRRTMEAAGFHYEAGDAALGRALLEEVVASAEPARSAPRRSSGLREPTPSRPTSVWATLYRRAIDEAGDTGSTRADAEAGLGVALMRMLVDLPVALEHVRRAARLAGGAARRPRSLRVPLDPGLDRGAHGRSRRDAVDGTCRRGRGGSEGAGGLRDTAFLVGLRGPAFIGGARCLHRRSRGCSSRHRAGSGSRAGAW